MTTPREELVENISCAEENLDNAAHVLEESIEVVKSTVEAIEDTSDARPFEDLRESGLLWLFNTTALHPRGYALALHFNEQGKCTGWSLVGDGRSPISFSEETARTGMDRVKETLRQGPDPAKNANT